MLQQMSQSQKSNEGGRNQNNTTMNRTSFTYSQEYANRKMAVKAQVDSFKQSMENLKRQPLNVSGKQSSSQQRQRSTSGNRSNERKLAQTANMTNVNMKHKESSESDLTASRFVDRTMGLSPPRSTTMMIQSPDNSKINIQGRESQYSHLGKSSLVNEQLQSQFPTLMQVAMGAGPQSNPEPIPSQRAMSNNAGGMTEAKNSLLSMDDLTLSATDGTALKQPKSIAPTSNRNHQ